MARGKPFTEEETELMMRMYSTGAKYREIGEALGRSQEVVCSKVARIRKKELSLADDRPQHVPCYETETIKEASSE